VPLAIYFVWLKSSTPSGEVDLEMTSRIEAVMRIRRLWRRSMTSAGAWIPRGRAHHGSATEHCGKSDVEGTHVSAVPRNVTYVRMFNTKDGMRNLLHVYSEAENRRVSHLEQKD
jgi:hypothetical protein